MLVLWLLDILLLQYGVAFQRDVLPWPNWSGMYNASQLVQETKNKIQASRTLLDARATPRSILQERFRRHKVKSSNFNEVPHEKGSTFTRLLYNPEGSTNRYYYSYESSIESAQGDEFNSSTDSDYDSDSSDHGTISDSSEDDTANRAKRCITLLPLLLSPRRKSNRQLSSERDDRLTSYRNNMLESPRRKHNYRRKQNFKSKLRSSYKYSAPYLGEMDMYENSESEPDTQTQIISTKNGVPNNILKYFTPPHNTLASTYVGQYFGSKKLFQCIENCKQRNLAEKIQGNEVQLQDRFGEKSSEKKDVPYNMLQMERKSSQTDAEELRSKEIDYIMDQCSHFAQEKLLSSKSVDTYSSKLNCFYLRPELITSSVNPEQDQENDTDEEYFEDQNWTLKTINDKKYVADKSKDVSEIIGKKQISTKNCNNNCQTITDTMTLNNMLKNDTLNHNVMAKQNSIPVEKTLMYDDPHTTDVLSQNTEVYQEMSQLSLENSEFSPHISQDRYIGATANTETNLKSYFYSEYPNTQEIRQNNSVKEFEYHDNYSGNGHLDNTFNLQCGKGDCRRTENVGEHHSHEDKITHEGQLSMGYTETSHEYQSTSYTSRGNDKQKNYEGNSNIQTYTEYFYTPDELTEDTEHYDDNLHDKNGYKTELFINYNIPSEFQNPNGVERYNSNVMKGETQSLHTDGLSEFEDTTCNNEICFDKSTYESQLSMGYTDTSHESQSTSYFSRGNDKQKNYEGNSNIQTYTEYFYTPDELTEDTEHYDDNPQDNNGYKTELLINYNIPSKFQNPSGVERYNSDVMTGETQSLTGYTDGLNDAEDTRCNNEICFDKSTYESQLSKEHTGTLHESQSNSYISIGNDKQKNYEANSNIQTYTEYFYTPDELTEDTEHYDDNLHDNNGYKTELLINYNIPSKFQNPNGVERYNSDVMTGETQSLTEYTDGLIEDTRTNKICFDKSTYESQLSIGYTDILHESQSTSYFSTENDKQNNYEVNSNIQSSTEYFYTPDELTEDTENYDDTLHDSTGYKNELFIRYNIPNKLQNPNGVERHNSDVMTGETQSLTGYTDGSNESEDTRCNNKNCFESSDTDAESQPTDSSSEDDNEFQDLPEFNVEKQRETYNNGDNINRGSLDYDFQGIKVETESSTNYLGVSDGDIQGFTNNLYLNVFSKNDEHSIEDKQGSYSSKYTNGHIQSSSECSYTKKKLHDARHDPSHEVNQSSVKHSEVQNEYQNTCEHFTGNFYDSTNKNREIPLSNQNFKTSNDFKDTSKNYPEEFNFRNLKGEIHVPATSSEELSELKETGQNLKDPHISNITSREMSQSLEYSNNSSEFQDIHQSSVSNKGSAYESQDTGGEILTSIKNSNFPNSEHRNNQEDSYDSSDTDTILSTLCSKESYTPENTKECFSSEDSQVVKSSNGEIQLISKYTDNANEFQDNNEYTIEDERSPHVSGDTTGNTESTMDFSESSNGLLSTYKHSMVNEQEPHQACDVREDTKSSNKYLEVSSKFQDINEQFIGDQVVYDLNNRYGETQLSTEFSDYSNELHDTVEDFDDLGRTEVSTEYTFILYRFEDDGENVFVKNDLYDFGDINRQIKLSTEYPKTQNEFKIYSEYEENSQVDTNSNTEIFNMYSDTQDEFFNKHYPGDSKHMYDYNTNYDTTLSSRHSNISCELEAAGEKLVRNENSDTDRTQPSEQHSDSGSEDNNEYELDDSKMSYSGPTLKSTEDASFPPTSTSSEEYSIYVLRRKPPQLQENNRFYEDGELYHDDLGRFEDETSTIPRYNSEYTEITSVCNKTHKTSSSDIQLQELHEDTVYLPFENMNDIELFTLSSTENDDTRYSSDGPFITQVESSESELSSEQSQNTDDSLSSWVTNLRYIKDKSNEIKYLEDDDVSSSDATEDCEYNKQEKCKTRTPITHVIGQNKDGIQTNAALPNASSAESIIRTRDPEEHTPKVIHHYYLMPVYIVTPHPSAQADIIISPLSDEDNLSDEGEKLTLTEDKAEIEQILRSYSDYKEYSSNTDTLKPVTSNIEDNTLLSGVVSKGPIMRYENNLFPSRNGQITGGSNGYTNKINSFSDYLTEDSFTDTQIPKSTSNQTFHDYLLGDQSLSSDTSQNMALISHSDMVESNDGGNAAWKEHNTQEKKQSLENDGQTEAFYSGRSYNVLDAIYNAHPTLEPPYTSRPLEYLVSSQCFQPGCRTLFGEFVKKIVEEKIEEYHKQIQRKCDQCAATPIQEKDNLFLDKIERASLTQELDDNGIVLGKAFVSDNEEACNSYIARKLDAVMNMLTGLKEWLMNSSTKGQ